MPRGPKFLITHETDPDGEDIHQWKLVAGNGKVIAESQIAWPERYRAVENARAVRKAAKNAPIEHQPEE